MKNSIVVDTREQDIQHILYYFQQNNIDWIRQKLSFGDYASKESKIIIERKRVGELAGNLTGLDKVRFSREFKRAKGYNMVIMIEGSIEDVKTHNYRSKLSPKEFESRIKTWANHFMFKVHFVKKEDAGEFIYKTLGGLQ